LLTRVSLEVLLVLNAYFRPSKVNIRKAKLLIIRVQKDFIDNSIC